MKSSQERTILKQFLTQPTKNRELILGIFMKNTRPIDTQFILDKLKEVNSSMDRVTVFRTINSFVESDLLNKLEFNEGKSRYELSLREHHHHLICANCGDVTCVDECGISNLEKKIEKETGFKTNSHRVEFFGICKKCTAHAK